MVLFFCDTERDSKSSGFSVLCIVEIVFRCGQDFTPNYPRQGLLLVNNEYKYLTPAICGVKPSLNCLCGHG